MLRLRLTALVAALVLGLAAPAEAQTDAPPRLQAETAVVVEASTGEVIYARRAEEPRAIASTTKLMTALLALEGASLDDVLTAVDYQATPAESLAGLEAGEKLTVRDLVRALLLPSGNDAAETIAQGIAGSRQAFVREMNARAKALGLENTTYANPVGLDEANNRSSALDLVKLAIVLRKNPFFRETVDMPSAVLTTGDRRRVLLNRNRLVREVGFVDGVKTGRTTQSGYVLVGSATRRGVTVVSAVLGEPSEAARDADSLALLRYGLARYRRATLTRKGKEIARVDLRYRSGDDVALVADRTTTPTLRRGTKPKMRVLGVPEEIDGPLPAGARVGTAEFRAGGRLIATVPLVTARPVEAAGLGTRLASRLTEPSSMLLLGLLGGCTVLLVALRRRVVRRAGVVR